MFRSCWHHLTHHRKLPGQTDVRWTWFQTAPFPEVLAPSLHQAKSCKKECWRFASNAFFGFLKMNYYIVPMASLSLFDLIGLSFARAGKNGDLIACASRKNFCSNCRESPQWPPKQMASRQALLGKDIHSEPSLHVQELLAPPEYTHHGQLPGQTEIRWAWFQTVPFPEVLAPSLHQAKSCKKEC